MILVIHGHILQIFFHRRADGVFLESAYDQWRAIYAFHMPLFFLLAGMASLYRDGQPLSLTVRRALSIILLAYAIDVVGILVSWGVLGAASLPTPKQYVFDHVLRADEFSTITVWFLVAMALVYIASAFYEVASPLGRVAILAVVVLLSAVSYLGPQWFHLRALAPGFVFFQIGRWLLRTQAIPPLGLSVLLLASAALTARFNSGCSLPWEAGCDNSELPGRFCVLMIFGFLGNLPLFFLSGFAGAMGVVGLSRVLNKPAVAASAVAPWLTKPLAAIGRQSLNLLILNGFALVLVNPLLRDRVPALDSTAYLLLVGLIAVAAHIVALWILGPALDRLELAIWRLTGGSRGRAVPQR